MPFVYEKCRLIGILYLTLAVKNVYGSKSMGEGGISQYMIFTVDYPQVFQADQTINFISVDEYGNISKISKEKLQLPPGYVPPSQQRP
mgnify:CR=1 FL=1